MSPGETGPLTSVRSHEPEPAGFGHRVEKILFVAEQEAAETRRSATRESTALIERARVEAEALRREGEQAAEAYRGEAERVVDQRAAELDAREREIEWHRENARVDADRRLAEAHHEADRIVADAVSEAEALRAELDEELAERRGEVERQMAWLEESRRAARDLAQMLLAQVGDGSPGLPELREHHVPAEPVDRGDDRGVRDEPDYDYRFEDPLGVDPVPPRGWVEEGTTTAVPEVTGETPATRGVAGHDPRPPRSHSPAVVPPAELRFAGTFGGVLGSVDEGVTDAGTGRLRATGHTGDHTERMPAPDVVTASHPLRRGRSA